MDTTSYPVDTAYGVVPSSGYICSNCGCFISSGAPHTCYYHFSPFPTYPSNPVPCYSFYGPTYAQFNEILNELRVVKEQLAVLSVKVWGSK